MALDRDYDIPIYTPAARRFHWLTVLLILIQFPIGLYMTYRAYEMAYVNDAGEAKTGLFDGTTNLLYDTHKVVGLVIFLVVILRLMYRFSNGAPPSDRSVPAPLIGVSHLTHWLIYLLLIAIPIGGYLGISYYGALEPFGIPLPAITEKDEKFSETVFWWHETAAFALLGLIALHIAASFYHRAIRKDRVVERMLPKRTV
ncbi:MAG: cytochrome b [Hyphomicrobium sp.]